MNEFFTLEGLLTFGGSAAVVTLVTTVVAYVVGPTVQPYLKFIALAVALGLAFLGAVIAGGDWTRWIVAAVNGLVLFLASVGANQLAAERTTARQTLEAHFVGEPTGWARVRQSWL